MPVRLYETLFLLDATKVSADADAAKASVTAVLEKHGSEIIVSRPWDENRKLAYPIKKQKKGYYQAIYYKADSLKLPEMEKDFALVEVILRQLTSAVDPKWEEAFLEMAKNDSQPGFAIRGMHDEAAPGDVTPNLGGIEGMEGEAAPAPRGRGRREYAEKPE